MNKTINNDYPLIPLSEITDEARKIAVRWGDEYFPGIAMSEKHKLASDIMNYSRRHSSQEKESLIKELIEEIDKMYKVEVQHDEKWARGLRYSIKILQSKLPQEKGENNE